MTWDDRERETRVDVDLGADEVTVQIVEEFRYAGLFDDDDELRLWEDSAGWSGFELDDGQVFQVNYNRLEDVYADRRPVSPDDFAESIKDHVKEPCAGSVGRFVRRASPPPMASDEAPTFAERVDQ